jgi:hypothetical protein
MKAMSTDALGLLERLAVAEARRKREQCLSMLDGLLTSLGAGDETALLDAIRAMFTAYEKPGMTTLSSEIEAI